VFASTPERVARGRYLSFGPPHCIACHSETDPNKPGRQPIPGRIFSGTHNPRTGLVNPNLTPDPETGSGTWTDEQLVRAIRAGIGHDGRQLSATHDFPAFSAFTDEDVQSIVVYIRSVPPIRNPLPKTLPISEQVNRDRLLLAPPVEPSKSDGAGDPVRRGAYLVRVGTCVHCHTPKDPQGNHLLSHLFGGGPSDAGVAANITFDPSGISQYDEAMFIQTMRTGKVGGIRELKNGMPWKYLGDLTDEDLRAIFAYLRTLPPVKHRVSTSPDVEETYCPIDQQKHGYGDLNVLIKTATP
jgi:mono/diheme cytochrome c family protein